MSIYAQIRSELLNCLGHEYAILKLREIVNKLLILIEKEIISRADISADFITDKDLENIEKKSLVTKVRKYGKYWDGGFTGWSIGLGGVISARLYDKTVKIKTSIKDYLKTIWGKTGWDNSQRVWRIEFELKREFLEQMKINTFSNLIEKINDILEILHFRLCKACHK